jgi:hypothetical protein
MLFDQAPQFLCGRLRGVEKNQIKHRKVRRKAKLDCIVQVALMRHTLEGELYIFALYCHTTL